MTVNISLFNIHSRLKLSLRQVWLISGALSVRRIFSLVRCNVPAVIDSVAIATTVSNLGELDNNNYYYSVPQFVAISNARTCMYVARRRYLTAPSVQKRYHWMNVSRTGQLRMS